jgi:pimeloyl-ACP methyl ester carboxylesterase
MTGADLNYEVSGDRRSPAVVFLHGFMGSSADWRESINPRLKSAIVPGVGHTVHAETPGAYTSLLWRFVDGLSFALGETKPVP